MHKKCSMNLSWIIVDPDLHTCNPESAKEIAVNVIAFPPPMKVLKAKPIKVFVMPLVHGHASGIFPEVKITAKASLMPEAARSIQYSSKRMLLILKLQPNEPHTDCRSRTTIYCTSKKVIQQLPITMIDEQTTPNKFFNACARILSIVMVAT